MQRLRLFNCKACCGFESHLDEQRSLRDFSFASTIRSPIRRDQHRACFMTEKVRPVGAIQRFLRFGKINGLVEENQGELVDEEEEEDDDLCPVDCVREFKTDEEFLQILEKAKETNSLVVVDFYRTSCGSCKYIEQGFSKLCKGSGDQEAPVIFLKHNVIDEYDEESEVADRLRIRAVPLFHFYKNGVLLEAFPTRDKERITEAILKYTTTPPQRVDQGSCLLWKRNIGRLFPKSCWQSIQWHWEWAILNPIFRSHHFPSATTNVDRLISVEQNT